jgi:RNA polymerase sigma factor (sigma-70 family)
LRHRVVERRALNSGSMRPATAAADPTAGIELRRAIAALPTRKRACVILRYLVGLSEAETADVLGISVGTVKSQTHKGLRQLREGLGETTAADRSASGAEGTVT